MTDVWCQVNDLTDHLQAERAPQPHHFTSEALVLFKGMWPRPSGSQSSLSGWAAPDKRELSLGHGFRPQRPGEPGEHTKMQTPLQVPHPVPLRTLCGGASGCWRGKRGELQAGEPGPTHPKTDLQTGALLSESGRGILLSQIPLSNLNVTEARCSPIISKSISWNF